MATLAIRIRVENCASELFDDAADDARRAGRGDRRGRFRPAGAARLCRRVAFPWRRRRGRRNLPRGAGARTRGGGLRFESEEAGSAWAFLQRSFVAPRPRRGLCDSRFRGARASANRTGKSRRRDFFPAPACRTERAQGHGLGSRRSSIQPQSVPIGRILWRSLPNKRRNFNSNSLLGAIDIRGRGFRLTSR